MNELRFDLEQRILNCWQVVDDLKTVYTYHSDNKSLDDDLANVLIGLQYLYQLKFEQLFKTFEDYIMAIHLHK
jgi:hypothetical protein